MMSMRKRLGALVLLLALSRDALAADKAIGTVAH